MSFKKILSDMKKQNGWRGQKGETFMDVHLKASTGANSIVGCWGQMMMMIVTKVIIFCLEFAESACL